MSTVFSVRLAEARRDLGASQKAVAMDLGVSQALLSHYEKGIRECGMDFIAKAAVYYDVSADYLLGLTDTKRSTADLLTLDELKSDHSAGALTLFRGISKLTDAAEMLGARPHKLVLRIFAMCIYRTLTALRLTGAIDETWLSLDEDKADIYASAAQDCILRELSEIECQPNAISEKPAAIMTAISFCESYIKTKSPK